MQIHFIEKDGNLHPIQPRSNEFESGNWDVSVEKAKLLVELGALIYFHETQGSPSHFGGQITGYRELPPNDPLSPGRIVFRFSRGEGGGKGVLAGPDGWRQEQKTIV